MTKKIIISGCTEFTLEMCKYAFSKQRLAGILHTQEKIKIKANNSQNIYRYSDLKSWADNHNVPYIQYERSDDLLRAQDHFRSKVLLLAGYHMIISKRIIEQFGDQIYALHASLLPKLRGWSPLNWAILLGLKDTGISLFRLDSGMDSGPIFMQKKLEIGSDTYISDLISQSIVLYKEILDVLFQKLDNDAVVCKKQNLARSTFCLRRTESDSQINWSKEANEITRLIRASSEPYFGAFSFIDKTKIRIFRARVDDSKVFGSPGQIYKSASSGDYGVCCGVGSILLEKFSSDELPFSEVKVLMQRNEYFE